MGSADESGAAGGDVPAEAGDDGPRPHVARVCDYILGGTDHIQVDREFAEEMLAVIPGLESVLRELRSFGARSVTHLAAQGVDQFLDLGSGIPSNRPAHEVAAAAGVRPRVVYVDRDQEVVTRSQRLVEGVDGVVVIRGDVADPAAFLADPELTATLDLDRPIGVLACAVLHYVDDATASAALAAVHRAVAPGSWLALAAMSGYGRAAVREWAGRRHGDLSSPPRLREPPRMQPWLDGWEVVAPGWVAAPSWRPEARAGPSPAEAGAAYWGVLARRC